VPNVSVIQQFLHPPLGLLTRELISGTFSGDGSLNRPLMSSGVDAFGLVFSFFTVPTQIGLTLGSVIEYEPRMVQLAVIHTLLDSHEVVSEYANFSQEEVPFLWSVALPTRIEYSIYPGVEIVFHWLLAL
jgi:hypothetical protein